jgi:hypothetical protein
MTTDALIILGGSLVAVLPFLGFPGSWDRIFFLILGVCIVALGIAVRRKQVAQGPGVKPTHFAESQPTDPLHSTAAMHDHEKMAQ